MNDVFRSLAIEHAPMRSMSENNGQPRNPPEPFQYNHSTARAVTRSLSNPEVEKTMIVSQKSKYESPVFSFVIQFHRYFLEKKKRRLVFVVISFNESIILI